MFATAMKRQARALAGATVGGLPVLDLAAALLLGAYAVALVVHGNGAVGASIGVLAMTLPVAWCRRAPVGAAAALALGAVLNAALFGSIVRCGAALPAVFAVAFFVAARCTRRRAALGLSFCAANVVTQSLSDPNLGAKQVVLLLPILGLFAALGLVLRARTAAIAALRRQTDELRRRRAETARLTVLADRARVSGDLDSALRERIGRIAAAAVAAREGIGTDSSKATAALVWIEHEGREVLRQMREIVGSLGEAAPSAPPPSLAELPALLARTTTAGTRLTVDGEVRRLPAGLELAGCRIAEHLVTALEDEPGATIDVRLRFAVDAFELHVSGPPSGEVELGAVLAAARERASLHNGTLEGATRGGVCHAVARLPLVSAHA